MRKIARALGLEFGEGRTEGGAPKPRRDDVKPSRPNRGGGENRRVADGEKRPADGPRSKRRRRRRRKPAATPAS
jgi:hypothetical protein